MNFFAKLLQITLLIALTAIEPVAGDDDPSENIISLERNRRGIARIHSIETGTAFVILTEDRKVYMLTAAHVVGGKLPDEPPCKIDFGTPESSVPCFVPYVWEKADLAIAVADMKNVPGTFPQLQLGDSAILPTDGSKIYTLGYPGGGTMRRQNGFISGMEPPAILVKGLEPHDGQSGSPVFTELDGKVIGVILERAREKGEQRISEIDLVKLYLRRDALFRSLMMFTRPPAGATGPLVASDLGLSLTNMFTNAVSPRRWYERAKRYYRTDSEFPKLAQNNNWLGVQRTYISSFLKDIGSFGRAWSSSFDYRIDVEKSNLCNLYLWNPRGVRVAMQPPYECAEVKRALAAHVIDQKMLDLSLRDILASQELSERVLPDNLSFTGADFDVARARFISGGIEISIGENKYIFNSRGKLRQLKFQGRSLELDYDSKDRLMLVRDGELSQEFSYSDQNLVNSVRFSDGSEYSYKYDAHKNLIAVDEAGQRVMTYAYDNNDRLTSVSYLTTKEADNWIINYFSDGSRSSVKKGDKEYIWSFIDDANDMPIVTQKILHGGEVVDDRRYEFDYHERSLNMTSNGQTTEYKLTECLCLPLVAKTKSEEKTYNYDPFGRLAGFTSPIKEIRQTYDNRYNKVNKVEEKVEGKWVVSGEAKYDDFGNLTEAKTQDNHLKISYDRQNRITSLMDMRKKKTVTMEYNLMGKPILTAIKGIGKIVISYKDGGEIDKAESPDGPLVAVQVASAFNNLLDAISPFTNSIDVDTRYSLITSEPDACDECGKYQED